jgi:archaellum component FlaG (FlaF/FlaG flagellin family)
MRLPALAVPLLAGTVAGLGGTATAGTAPPAGAAGCGALLAPQAAVLTPFTVSGQTVQLRDPYGGQVSRNRLFVSFGLQYPTPAARAAVSSVAWQVDGVAFPATGTGPARQLNFGSMSLSAGPHTITAVVTPADGTAAVQAQTTVTATDCQAAAVFPDMVNGKAKQPASIQVSGGGPALTSVTLGATGLRAALPASLAGRKVGTLQLFSVDTGDVSETASNSYTLKAPARAGGGSATLLSRGGLTVRLKPGTSGSLVTVSGLPSSAQAITITTKTGVLSVTKACPLPTLKARLSGGTGAPVTVTTGIDISKNC